jgi:Putative peptidoglycan binding domain
MGNQNKYYNMQSRFTRWAAGAAVTLSLFAGAGMAQASSLTSTQVSAILSLLQSFGADQGTINNVSIALGGSPAPQSSCINLSSNFTLGSSGSDVTTLQNYLINKGELTGTSATGYYGYLTASAVGQLQVSLGIVSSQSDSAYGIMGPKTRAAVGCGGTTTVSPAQPVQPTTPTSNNGGFSVSPLSGAAPLTVSFSEDKETGLGNVVDFGDGSVGELQCGLGLCSVGHTYTIAGTYTAKLGQGGCKVDDTCSINSVVTSQTITVTGASVASPSATIDPYSLNVNGPLSLGYPVIAITGSALNTSNVYVVLLASSYTGATDWNSVIANNNYLASDHTAVPYTQSYTATFVNPLSAGNYQVLVYDTASHALLATGTLNVKQGAIFTVSPSSVPVAFPGGVSFTAPSFNSGAEYIDFGDGTTSNTPGACSTTKFGNADAPLGGQPCGDVSGKIVSHAYTSPGVYTANLYGGTNSAPLAPSVKVTITSQ